MEQAGIPTVTLNNFRPHAECVRPPRVVHLTDYPFGAQWGPPKMLDMQRIVVEDALQALVSIQVPGTIIDLPHRWGDARRGLLQRYLR